MKFNMTNAAILGLFLVFGTTQVQAGECKLTVTRVPCSEATKTESFKKCQGKPTCDIVEKTGTEQACEKAAIKECENKANRWAVTMSKTLTAKFDGKDVNGGKDLCDAKRDGFNKCNEK